MNFKTWWRRKDGQSKAVTILATLLILEIGLCFSTPYTIVGVHRIFRIQDQPLQGLGLMLLQAVACFITLVLLFFAFIAWPSGVESNDSAERDSDDR